MLCFPLTVTIVYQTEYDKIRTNIRQFSKKSKIFYTFLILTFHRSFSVMKSTEQMRSIRTCSYYIFIYLYSTVKSLRSTRLLLLSVPVAVIMSTV